MQAAETVWTLNWLWGATDSYFLLSDSLLGVVLFVDMKKRASELNLITDGGKKMEFSRVYTSAKAKHQAWSNIKLSSLVSL